MTDNQLKKYKEGKHFNIVERTLRGVGKNGTILCEYCFSDEGVQYNPVRHEYMCLPCQVTLIVERWRGVATPEVFEAALAMAEELRRIKHKK